MTQLEDTDASAIAAEFVRGRLRAGSPAMGMVMTLVVVASEADAPAAMDAARQASYEHPARVLALILGRSRGLPHIDAEVGHGSGWTGESATIRLRGEVVDHPDSVVLSLLLPDSPVVVWWPTSAPQDPAADALGALATRRITDVAHHPRGQARALAEQAAAYAEGNTDLAWARTTGWRSLLAASLDQHPCRITRATVTSERVSPSADLLAAWLSACLDLDVERIGSRGPGITGASLEGPDGTIAIARTDEHAGTLSMPGQPDRPVALRRRAVADLLAEELRRLDPDEVYERTTRRLVELGGPQGG